MVSWRWIGTSVEGSGRGLIYGIVVTFERMNESSPQDTSVEISGLWIDIWNLLWKGILTTLPSVTLLWGNLKAWYLVLRTAKREKPRSVRWEGRALGVQRSCCTLWEQYELVGAFHVNAGHAINVSQRKEGVHLPTSLAKVIVGVCRSRLVMSGCHLHCSYKTPPNTSVNYGLPERDAV